MRKITVILGAIPFLLCSIAFGKIHNELQVKPGDKLVIDLETGGGVEIHGWNKDTVSVDGYMQGRESEDCSFEMKKISNGVKIESRFIGDSQTSSNFHFDISVPQKFDIDIDSAGGDVKIISLEGNMEGSTGGGEIMIRDSKGKVHLSTGGGQIHVAHSHADGEVSTGGGDVIFDDVSGGISGSTGGGQVIMNGRSSNEDKDENDNEEEDENGSPQKIVQGGGDVSIHNAPNGISVSTGGGDIHIGSAKHKISASTGGGEIVIDAADGTVSATTGGGDIQVKMISQSPDAHDVELGSGGGDITLVVPANFSMDLDLKLGFTREARHVDIISDFPLNRRATSDWSSEEGTPRKYIYGTGKLSGGKNHIRISTVNGNIYIKKG